jgi:virginiamycin B lyase
MESGMLLVGGGLARQSIRVGGGILAMILGLSAVGWSQTLPDGPGKAIVVQHCTRCHNAQKFTDLRLTQQDWRENIELMVRYGVPLSASQVDEVTAYLTTSFPGEPRPAAIIKAGSVQASIEEWTLPTPGSRPHDPAVAPDGSVWYTGQAGDMIGRLDPATGQFTEYPIKTPKSPLHPYGVGPHGLIADRSGSIWFTAQLAGYIGKLDPKTGAIAKYPMPIAAAKDPHTPIFDQRGTLWFTLQQSNMVGRLNPQTGDVTVVPVPTAKSEPYGIVVNSKGVPFFCELTGNRLARIDPDTMAIHEYVLPTKGTAPRRIAVSADDTIWYTDYARGYLGHLDPATGKVDEWASPSGATDKTQPYAITAVGDIIWYVESGVTPNAVVRFDPTSQVFQSWPIPSGGGVVRHMMADATGNLWLACSGLDRLARVLVASSGASR